MGFLLYFFGVFVFVFIYVMQILTHSWTSKAVQLSGVWGWGIVAVKNLYTVMPSGAPFTDMNWLYYQHG